MQALANKSIKIGEIELDGFVYIPPMAGVTDIAYRILCREFDPNVLLSTEMLSSKSMLHAHKHKKDHNHTKRMQIPEGDPLTGIQIFGHEPDVMAAAARLAQEAGAKFIDINMGCPVAKLVNGMDGAALMKDPELACEIVQAVMQSTNLPVTIKTRLGWCEDTLNAPDLCRRFQDLGVQALTIHGRTRAQKYSGSANWEMIAEVVDAVDLPVFANGDIKNLDDAIKALEVTGAAGMAIARATMGKPWLSKQVNHFIKTGEKLEEPNANEKLDLALKHSQLLLQYKGDYIGIQESRRHINNYTSGMRGASKMRQKINQAENFEQAKAAVEELRAMQ